MNTSTKRFFGSCSLGEVDCITLSNPTGMTVEVLTLGATIRSLVVPDKNNTPTDVALGFDTPQAYLDSPAFVGGCIGRCANRIGGSSFDLDGQTWRITANQDNTHHLHGGRFGYDKRLWKAKCNTDGSATFTLIDLHMEEGYPGDVNVRVTFALTDDNSLHITYEAQTDRTTVVNLTHHPYFNLNGHGTGTVEEHTIRLDAAYYTPANDAGIPNGEIRQVAGSPLDLRSPARLGDCIHHPALSHTRGLDHNFVLPWDASRPVAWVWSEHSGITMEIASTLPGVQAYTGGFFGDQTGKQDAQYHNHYGFALEPQFFPNAIQYPHFPSPILERDAHYCHKISYHFTNT